MTKSVSAGPRWLTAALVVGLMAGSGWAVRRFVPPADHYHLPFRHVTINPPPAFVTGDLLAEVQARADLADPLDTRAPELAKLLQKAFAAHPWVEGVDRVAVEAPRRVRVTLRYRWPAAVVVAGGDRQVVDRQGVTLPALPAAAEAARGLLEIQGAEAAAGPGVAAAARLAWLLAADRAAWQVTAIVLGADPLRPDVRFRCKDGTVVLWEDVPPAPDLAPAADRLQRLRDYHRRYGGLAQPGGPYELDVRPPGGVVRRAFHPRDEPPGLPRR